MKRTRSRGRQLQGSVDEDLSSLRVVDLKKRLKELGLSTQGLKAELVARLAAALAQADGGDGNLEMRDADDVEEEAQEPPKKQQRVEDVSRTISSEELTQILPPNLPAPAAAAAPPPETFSSAQPAPSAASVPRESTPAVLTYMSSPMIAKARGIESEPSSSSGSSDPFAALAGGSFGVGGSSLAAGKGHEGDSEPVVSPVRRLVAPSARRSASAFWARQAWLVLLGPASSGETFREPRQSRTLPSRIGTSYPPAATRLSTGRRGAWP